MERSRRGRFVSLSIVVGILMTLLVPVAASGGAAEPSIAFLNPSGFSEAGERGYIVSNSETDAGPGCCGASDGLFRFSAWVDGAPAGSSVFFSVVQGTLDYEIVGVSNPEGSSPGDTWDASWDIPPDVLNGPAVAHAYLVLRGKAIAHASLEVTIMKVEDSVDIAYPQSGGAFGTYSPLETTLPAKGTAARKKPVGIVDALYTNSPDMSYVRTFYTTSAAGTVPQWKECGTETIGSEDNEDPANGSRCTFASEADAAAVTAVAAVVNGSPGSFEARFNQSGDAVRVIPYAQRPAALAMQAPVQQTVAKNDAAGRFYCSETLTATLTDRRGRLIAGANVDIEAVGPTDGLKFHASLVDHKAETFATPVAPDRGGHTEEPSFDCTGSNAATGVVPTNAGPDVQGEHPVFGFPDVKHVETAAGGTTDRGTFGFRLNSNGPGVTHYTVWTDEADDGCVVNDDRFTTGELAASGSLGWGVGAEPPVPFEPEAIEACPGGTETRRTVALRTRATRVAAGTAIRLSGRVRSAAACISGQLVTVKSRRPGGRFQSAGTAITNAKGGYRLKVTVRATRDYRAFVAAGAGCTAARSRILRIAAT